MALLLIDLILVLLKFISHYIIIWINMSSKKLKELIKQKIVILFSLIFYFLQSNDFVFRTITEKDTYLHYKVKNRISS